MCLPIRSDGTPPLPPLSGRCVQVKSRIRVRGLQGRTRRRHAPQLQTLIQSSYAEVPGWKKTCVLNYTRTNLFPVQEYFIFKPGVWVKRAAVSAVKWQTIISPPPTTSSYGSKLRFSRMQMGDVIPPASPDSALGSLPGLARCLDRFSS